MKKSTALKPICIDAPPPGADGLLKAEWNTLDDVVRRVAWGNYSSTGKAPSGIELIKAHAYLTVDKLPRDAQHRFALAYVAAVALDHEKREREQRKAHATEGGKSKPNLFQKRVELLEQMFADNELTTDDRDQLRHRNFESQRDYCAKVQRVFGSWLASSSDPHAKELAKLCRDPKHWQAIRKALETINRLPKP